MVDHICKVNIKGNEGRPYLLWRVTQEDDTTIRLREGMKLAKEQGLNLKYIFDGETLVSYGKAHKKNEIYKNTQQL